MKNENKQTRPVFPFTAIVGQKNMKTALILNMIDPKIGGVMMMGDRGTGKSTVVRSLIDVLPDIRVVNGDPYNRSAIELKESIEFDVIEQPNSELAEKDIKTPLVDLPLGATEDRICGTIDIEKALANGQKDFEPGLLAKAHRGLLYVDEVNLLDDHLVDVLLDSAASGYNTVEREGISIQHPAKFILIGSGNPEEGELRPQLLDRFGLYVNVKTEDNSERRLRIVMARMEFDENPQAFLDKWEESQSLFRQRIARAREILPTLKVDPWMTEIICSICSDLKVDGLRGDLVLNRAITAAYAFEPDTQPNDTVPLGFIIRANLPALCLAHRLRKDPLSSVESDAEADVTNYFFDALPNFNVDPYDFDSDSLYEQEDFSMYGPEDDEY